MKVKCEYCGAYIDNTKETCPQCGAANKSMNRSANGAPRTIEELKKFCEDNNMPLEKMRFFIGEDYRGPKAFGIYKDGDNVIVYKNKADGARAVRYEGNDEEYGVNEIYQKMKEEIAKQMAGGNVTPIRNTRASTMASKTAGIIKSGRKRLNLRTDFILFFSGVVIMSSIAVLLLVWFLDSVDISSQSDSQRRSTYENSAPVQNDNYVPPSNHRPSRSDYGYDSYRYLYDDYLYDYDYDYYYDYDYNYDTYDSYNSYSDYGYDSYNYDSYDYSDSWDSYDYSDSWNSDSWDSYDYDYGGWDSDYMDWGSDW